jgi:hypothetical protein
MNEPEEAAGPAIEAAGAVPEEVVSAPEIPAVAGALSVFLQGPLQVATGEEFVLAIAVDGARNLASAPLIVSFPVAQLAFVRAEEGDLLGRGGAKTVFTASADSKQGRVIVGGKQVSAGVGASGAGTLARLVFRGKAPGPAMVTLGRFNFQDAVGNRLPATSESFNLEVR